ncbi:SMI1/KNR4 family protein [Nodosilinea sp. AN01ver1]|uniref:SMI1/KNR4 family protein n=1 Tax=Nodosilinea sp. AN01ver1 TaxID=3423362 RepID=UPI003D314FFA
MTIEDLVSSLEIVGSPNPDIFTLEDLAQFEMEAGFRLPDDYKQFCRTLGSGQFGGHMKICCPRIEYSRKSISFMKIALWLAKEEFGNFDLAQEIKDLLNACFVFGTNPNCQDVVWDLRTYQESDDSYDIYLIPLDPLDEFYFLGRSFLKFLEDFCIGEQGYKNLPEHLYPCEGTIARRFTRYDSSIGSVAF